MEKETINIWRSGFSLYDHNQEFKLYIYSGCSNHVIENNNKFLSLKQDKWFGATFGNKKHQQDKGKGIDNLNGKTKI